MILPVIGWLIGVVLLWVSDAWDRRDKLIGTLVVPGGLLLPLGLLTIAVTAGSVDCGTPVPVTGAPTETPAAPSCIDGSGGTDVLSLIALIVLLLAPFATTAYLARRLRRPGPASL